MSNCVLDASAVLAVLFKEPGEEVVRPLLRGSLISSVNAAEVIYRRLKNGESLEHHARMFANLELRVIEFDFDQAVIAASFKPYARSANLSFADRACLSLGLLRGLPVLSTEHDWAKVEMGVDVRLIRQRRS